MPTRRTTTLTTPNGPVDIFTYVTPEELAGYELDPGIGVFSRYRSIITSKQTLEEIARDPEANLTLAIAQPQRIVGYVVRRRPKPPERWAMMDPPIMHELFGELARGWRGMGIIRPMVEMVVLEPENEERILYIVGYSWHWDLDGTGRSLMEYRQSLISLLAPLGFKIYPTNEPNVNLRPENLFMARLGAKVEADPVLKRKFTNLLFGISPEED